ncbi:GNAT family N-acetyltransferase [Proteiniclasticum ruminis]|uniref:Acetyltransferase (GNAT) domain-containing protein n=1 Tax=Proteiniclasticum ruminis TaxID=398199 RepID=A0A1G8KI86_9CLOT|nr:GNAT family N-acetyltransferase [Proteiniclasticum ruminis]SDI43105.1 Acetyltransferase (GNAT) domain-containing protein [Proteiniclasticum ruminis]
MVIRKYADSRDFKKLLGLFITEELIKGDLRKKSTKEKLRQSLNKSVTYVAYEEEDLVGIVRGLEDLPFEPLVRDVYVKPLYRRKGIGKSLLYCLFERLSCDRIEVSSSHVSFASQMGLILEVGAYYVRRPEEPTTYLLQDKTERKQRRKKRKTRQVHGGELYEEELFGSDDFHYMIMGYTSGGASFGITWEEAYEDGLIEEEGESFERKRDEKVHLSDSYEEDELPF